MDLSGLHLLDPVLIDSVRDTFAVAHERLASVAHALAPGWIPDGSHHGLHLGFGDPTAHDPNFADPGHIDTVEAPADKPPTTPPDKRIVEGSLEKKDTPGTGGPSSTVDFSIWGIVSRADPIAKVVIAILSIASVWSWAIIFEKIIALRSVNSRSDKFEDRFWSGGSVDQLFDEVGRRPNSPMAALFAAAMREWRQSTAPDHATGQQTILGGVKERIERVMHVTLGREMGRLERNVGFLATVGATAPFIGLFGTVWGIMNSFQHIAIQKNTNLATVAPGISEALFATALGLLAAIPAVIAYNRFSGELDRYAHRLEGFTGEFTAIVSRQLEGGVR